MVVRLSMPRSCFYANFTKVREFLTGRDGTGNFRLNRPSSGACLEEDALPE